MTVSFVLSVTFCISIHAPRMGARRASRRAMSTLGRFQSTRPVWGATNTPADIYIINRISIHAPRVGRDCPADCAARVVFISIHAPRVGRDLPSRIL